MKKGFSPKDRQIITKVVREELRLSPTNLSKAFTNAAKKLNTQGIRITKGTITTYYYTKGTFLYRGGKELGACFSIISDKVVSTNCRNIFEGVNENSAKITPKTRVLTIKKLAIRYKLHFKR